ncbi:methionine/alanine import family NSS transporter small subunit [Virgibacillus oceani]|nr:methionine/alanine import family NSS transporter small subunit [Virgibacillus oceani]
MSGSAIFVMILGMVILWGGLIASIVNAVKKGKASNTN